MKRVFELGKIVFTTNAYEHLEYEDIFDGLKRHATCDWGDISPEDKIVNDAALKNNSRILSAYKNKEKRTEFWIITEADRSITTVLLPDDY